MRTLPLLFLACCAQLAHADSRPCFGDVIEYTTFLSTIIPPDVARAHDIVRSKRRVITNITLLRGSKPVEATITGSATNLLNQITDLKFREVREAGAIYYLASQVVEERDTITYSISVRPADANGTCRLRFVRDYYRAGS